MLCCVVLCCVVLCWYGFGCCVVLCCVVLLVRLWLLCCVLTDGAQVVDAVSQLDDELDASMVRG